VFGIILRRITQTLSKILAAGNVGHLPQSSSASRPTAGASGFLNLSQSGERPDLGVVQSLPLRVMSPMPTGIAPGHQSAAPSRCQEAAARRIGALLFSDGRRRRGTTPPSGIDMITKIDTGQPATYREIHRLAYAGIPLRPRGNSRLAAANGAKPPKRFPPEALRLNFG
jgi:hypothetical protein